MPPGTPTESFGRNARKEGAIPSESAIFFDLGETITNLRQRPPEGLESSGAPDFFARVDGMELRTHTESFGPTGQWEDPKPNLSGPFFHRNVNYSKIKRPLSVQAKAPFGLIFFLRPQKVDQK
jgi:hypothetical protein